MFPRPDFFAGARLNFAENLLFPEGIVDTDIACITVTEDGNSSQTTWSELRESVRQCSNALRASGVKPGDIVVGFISNHVQSLVAMLAAATIGAIWTAISLENGVAAALDRFGQLEPAVLFVDDGMIYNEKQWSSIEKASEIVEKLKAKGLKLVVMITKINKDRMMDRLKSTDITTIEYDDFLKRYLITNPPYFRFCPILMILLALQMHLLTLSSCLHLTLSTFFSLVVRQVFPRPLCTAHWEH